VDKEGEWNIDDFMRLTEEDIAHVHEHVRQLKVKPLLDAYQAALGKGRETDALTFVLPIEEWWRLSREIRKIIGQVSF
jgi:hypothetical protein